jgi:CRISPR/Cas system-associated exonuclease Cas4 (RecB family)
MNVYLSASSIKDFMACPQKVLYRIKKPFPEVKNKEMIIGNIAHSAIEKGWHDKKAAYRVVHDLALEEGLSKADVTQLEFCIDIFFLNFSHLVGKGDLIEYRFKIPLY